MDEYMTLPHPCEAHGDTPCVICHPGARMPRSCTLHGVAPCMICHRHEGQCDRGGCMEDAEVNLMQRPIRVGEYQVQPGARSVCRRCACKAVLFGEADATALPEDLRELPRELIHDYAVGRRPLPEAIT